MHNKKFTIFLFFSMVFFLVALLVYRPDITELEYEVGLVGGVVLKDSGVGANFSIEGQSGDITWFNISSVTESANARIRSLSGGENVEVWYFQRRILFPENRSPWQLVIQGEKVIKYEDEMKAQNLTIKLLYILAFSSFIFSCFVGLLERYRQR